MQRHQLKCSACRRIKKQCIPHDRDVQHQKCDYCERHELPCGPNVRKRDEPEVVDQLGVEGNSQEPALQTPVQDSAVAPVGNNGQAHSTSFQRPSMGESYLKDRREEMRSLSNDELEGKALSKLEHFKVFGVATKHIAAELESLSSQGFANTSGGYDNPYDNPNNKPYDSPYNHLQTISLMISGEMHDLFIYITELGIKADERNLHILARLIFVSLLYALEKYPGLYDDQKRDPLLQMAAFFQRIEDQCEFEQTLEKVEDLKCSQGTSLGPNPCQMLAESYTKTSERVSQALLNLWQTKRGSFALLNCNLSPLQRAARRRSPGIAQAVFSKFHNSLSLPDIFNLQSLHAAAALGMKDLLNGCIRARVSIDAKDSFWRTALALAALYGHEPCCSLLLDNGADVNMRDISFRSVLELAAHGGHLKVAKMLVGRGAEVNPVLPYFNRALSYLGSTPLHAAIESSNYSPELVKYLLDENADVYVKRTDQKNAIDLSRDKGIDLIKIWQRKDPKDQNYPFQLGGQRAFEAGA